MRLRRGRNLGSGCVSQNGSRFCRVLSVSVVPSVSVESAMECQNDVSYGVFFLRYVF